MAIKKMKSLIRPQPSIIVNNIQILNLFKSHFCGYFKQLTPSEYKTINE
jgi:hypothetical protein